ncbi:MAG: phosphoribosylaminoimidazolecarboxamide formyltransferase [Sphaerochaetaceae bacterium]|nr:phosphoribosylaminoimidazolecarboxamide formyltransferase [Sphaerochaetaceae bacterium]
MRIDLKYGCNPNQKTAYIESAGDMPLTVLNGRPGYINLMDALNGWQLVQELKSATGLAAATSFKHVSPAGAAVALPLSDTERRMYFVPSKKILSPLATAYIRARGADRMASFGDFISLSDVCDVCTASIIAKEVSDGVIAPGYEPEALEILKGKKGGGYLVLQMDSSYVPAVSEKRTLFGLEMAQDHNGWAPSEETFSDVRSACREIPASARLDLTVALIALKYTQSNSVCYAYHGQTIGVGAGQQSRLACTRLAGTKADLWSLRQSEKVLNLQFLKGKTRNDKDNIIEQYLADDPEIDVVSDWKSYFSEKPERLTAEEKKSFRESLSGISLASDGFFPFRDNIDRAAKSGVSYVAEPGGSARDEDIIRAADDHDMVLVFTHSRLFHH